MQNFGNNPIPVLGSGAMILPFNCQAPNFIVNGMCVLQSSLPSNQTVTQAVYGMLRQYYGSIHNCAAIFGAGGQGGCSWFTWQATDPPVQGENTGRMVNPNPQPAGTYLCGSDAGANLYCVTRPNP